MRAEEPVETRRRCVRRDAVGDHHTAELACLRDPGREALRGAANVGERVQEAALLLEAGAALGAEVLELALEKFDGIGVRVIMDGVTDLCSVDVVLLHTVGRQWNGCVQVQQLRSQISQLMASHSRLMKTHTEYS